MGGCIIIGGLAIVKLCMDASIVDNNIEFIIKRYQVYHPLYRMSIHSGYSVLCTEDRDPALPNAKRPPSTIYNPVYNQI